jgi:hypothetical protein
MRTQATTLRQFADATGLINDVGSGWRGLHARGVMRSSPVRDSPLSPIGKASRK